MRKVVWKSTAVELKEVELIFLKTLSRIPAANLREREKIFQVKFRVHEISNMWHYLLLN